MITVEIPENTEKLKQIITALERQIKVDSEKDKRIHQAALNSLRAARYILKQIITALERQIKVDSEKDKRIHQAALNSLRAALREREGN